MKSEDKHGSDNDKDSEDKDEECWRWSKCGIFQEEDDSKKRSVRPKKMLYGAVLTYRVGWMESTRTYSYYTLWANVGHPDDVKLMSKLTNQVYGCGGLYEDSKAHSLLAGLVSVMFVNSIARYAS